MSVRTVGIEEELLLVDATTGERTTVSSRVLHRHRASGRAEAAGPEGDLEGELLQHMVETHTDPATDLDQIAREARAARRTAIAAATEAGVAVAAVAAAPIGDELSEVSPDDRYERIISEFGDIGRAAGTLGMHVHVECDDDDERVRVVDRLRPWLPSLVAIASNSPFADERDTGYSSWRHQVWSRWPAAGPAEPFGSVETYHRVCADLIASGAAMDEGMLYFDARLAADLPTVEIRVADVCTDVDDSLVVAALARALVSTLAEEPDLPQLRTDLLRAAHWRAARDGLDGSLVHPCTGSLVPAGEALAALVDRVGPALDEAGDRERVERGLERLRTTGTGARRQRRALERTGSMGAVVDDLVARTTASARADEEGR